MNPLRCLSLFGVAFLVASVVRAQPFNHSLAKATPINGTHATMVGNFSATGWWSWQCPADGLVQVTPPANGGLVVVSALDEFENATEITRGSTAFTFFAGKEQQYAFAVGSLWPQTNDFVAGMNLVSRPANWLVTSPAILSGTNIIAIGCADPSPGDSFVGAPPKSLWWQWTPPGYGNVTWDTLLSSRSVALDVFQGTPPNLFLVSGMNPGPNPFSVFARPGSNYLIRTIGGDNSGTNRHVLRIVMPSLTLATPNDFFTNAIRLPGNATSVTGTLVRSLLEPGEPSLSPYYQSVWYRWTLPGRGNAQLSVIGAQPVPARHSVTAYRGAALGQLVNAGSTFAVRDGDDVAIAVDGFDAAEFELLLAFFPSPANDDFVSALPVSLGEAVNFSSRGATLEDGEPNHAGVSPPYTVWFTWTADASSPVTVLARSTNANAVLAVYTGASLTNLALVAASDNYLATSADAQVSFNGTASEIYRIAVSTRSGGGDVQLLVKQGVPPVVSFISSPAGRTNAAGATYDFDITATDADGSIASVTFLWGNQTVLLTTPPFHVTFTNLVAGTYSAIAVATDNDGLKGGTSFLSYRVTPFNDAATNRAPLTLNVVADVPVLGAVQQSGEPFAATWSSFMAPSNGVYLVYSSGTRLAVYEVNGASLVLRANRSSGSTPARLAFTADAGVEFAIASGNSFSTPTVQLCVTNGVTNDFFTNAVVLPGPSGSVSAPVFAATMEPGETNHTGIAMQSSTWWRWTAPASGTLFLEPDSLGSPAAVAYSGLSVSNLVSVGRLPRGRPSPWVAPVTAGSPYAVALACGGSDGLFTATNAASTASLRYQFYPIAANDAFSNAIVLSGENPSVIAHNFGATSETGDPAPGGASIWWKWTAPRSGIAYVAIHGYSPQWIAYSGSTLPTLSAVSILWTSGVTGFREAQFPMTAGATYYISVSGLQEEFDFTIFTQPPANDAFTNRFTVSGTPLVLTGELFTATAEAGENLGNRRSLWWSWTATNTEIVTLTPNPYYEQAFVFTGDQLSLLAPVPRIGSGSMTFFAQDGVTYQIALAGYPQSYSHTAAARLAPNDPPHVSFSTPTNGQRFTVGELVPVCVIGQDTDSVITSVKSGFVERSFSNSTATSCFTLSNLPAGFTTLTAVATDDDGVTTAAAPTTMRVAPVNDDFEQRTLFRSNATEVVGFNTGAGAQSGEPPHAGIAASTSVWWSWTATQTGTWTLTAAPCDFHPALAIYTGTELSSLVPVPVDDLSRPGDLRSDLAFSATAGAIYHFAVDTKEGVTGHFRLSLSQRAANDAFTNAAPMVSRSVLGRTTVAATVDAGETNASHSLWFAWTAPASGAYFASTAGSDFDTTLDVFTGTSLPNAVLVGTDDDSGPGATSLVQFSGTNGQAFRFRVDGFGGDSGAAMLVVAPVEELSETIAPGNTPRVTLFGFPFAQIEVQESTNLVAWRSLGTQRNNGGWFDVSPSSNSVPARFFRAIKH